MADEKKKEQKGGRPENWQEICMARVPTGKPPKAKKVEKSKKSKG